MPLLLRWACTANSIRRSRHPICVEHFEDEVVTGARIKAAVWWRLKQWNVIDYSSIRDAITANEDNNISLWCGYFISVSQCRSCCCICDNDASHCIIAHCINTATAKRYFNLARASMKSQGNCFKICMVLFLHIGLQCSVLVVKWILYKLVKRNFTCIRESCCILSKSCTLREIVQWW